MKRPQRIFLSIAVTIIIAGFNAYNTAHRNGIDYQEHPVASILGSVTVSPLAGLVFYWLSGILVKRRGRKPKTSLSSSDVNSGKVDDKFYDEVALELQGKSIVAGLWTKAYAEMGGDDAKARALYIRYRIAQLAEANRQRLEQDRIKRQPAAMKAVKQQARSRLHTLLTILWGLLTFLFGGFGFSFIIEAFTEGFGNFSTDIVGGSICLSIAFLFGLATRHCYKEMQ